MPRRNVSDGAPPSRIVGIDIARAIAVIGMFGSHTLNLGEVRLSDPATYPALIQGHSAATFIMLAGLSISLLSGGTRQRSDTELVRIRHLLLVRACLIFFIGSALQLLGTPIVIILVVYGFLFVAALPLLRTQPSRLFTAAAIMAATMPIVMPLLDAVLWKWAYPYGALYDILFAGGLPALTWGCYFLVGLALGRLDLSSRAVIEAIGMRGAALAGGAYLLAAALGPVRDILDPGHNAPAPSALPDQTASRGEFGWSTDNLVALLGADAYSSTTLDIIGCTGISMVIIAGCLALFPQPTRFNEPLRAAGQMALTLYCLHIVAIYVLYLIFPVQEDQPARFLGVPTWATFSAIAIVTSTLWLRHFRRGPVEAVIHTIAARSAGPVRV